MAFVSSCTLVWPIRTQCGLDVIRRNLYNQLLRKMPLRPGMAVAELSAGHRAKMGVFSMHSRIRPLLIGIVAAVSAWNLAAQADTRREIQSHFDLAQTALKNNQFDKAAAEFREILRLDPKSASAHANLGMIAYRQADFARAVSYFSVAVKLNPSLWDAQAFLGISHVRLGHNQDAKPFLEATFPHLQNAGLRTEVGLHLITLAQESNTPDHALDVLRQLQVSNPTEPEVLYVASRVYSDLAAEALGSLARSAPDSARTHQILAQAALTQDDVAGAIGEYRKALQIDPHLPGAHFELGRAILQAAQDEPSRQEAQKEFEAELAGNPNDSNSENELGLVYSLRADFETAIRHYSRALALRPDFVDAHLALGKILTSLDRPDEAFQHFREAVRLDPSNEVAHYRLAQAYRKAGNDAEADLEQAKFQMIRDSRLPAHSAYNGKEPSGQKIDPKEH